MSINQEELTQIATLARLSLDAKSLDKSTEQINNILSFVEQLDQINTDDIVPMAHPLAMNQRLRIDEVTEIDQHAAFQKNAPLVDEQYYLVPTVIQ